MLFCLLFFFVLFFFLNQLRSNKKSVMSLVSNRLDPDQTFILSDLFWDQNVSKVCQQMSNILGRKRMVLIA